MRISVLVLITFCSAILFGCNIKPEVLPPVFTQLDNQQELTYIIPKDLYRRISSIRYSYDKETSQTIREEMYDQFDPFLHGVEIATETQVSYGKYPKILTGTKVSVNSNILTISKINGEMYQTGSEYYSETYYNARMETVESENYWETKLTPYAKVAKEGAAPLFSTYPVPDYEYNEFVADAKLVKFTTLLEINSKYSVESVSSNFSRLLEKKSKTEDIFKSKSKNCSLIIYPKFFPYKDGSKVTGKANVICKHSDNIVNIVELQKEARSYIEKIVNDWMIEW